MPGWPPVSVVMPVRNEARHLAESVRHILQQDYPGEIELVLAVGPSRDRTLAIAGQLAADNPRVIVVPNPAGKIPSGVNSAIKAARFGIITRVDGHAMLPPGYLRTAVRTLQETGAADVGGVMAAEGVTPFEQAVAWAMTSKAGVGGANFHTGGQAGPVDSVYLGVYRRVAIEKAGGYDEHYLRAEDWELNHRIRLSGGIIWFAPDLRVTYRPRSSPRALGAQYFHYGRWRRVVARQHTGTINLRYLAPPAAVSVIAAGTAAGVAGLAGLAAGSAGRGGLAGPRACDPRHLPGRDHRGRCRVRPWPGAQRAYPGAARPGYDAPVLGGRVPDQPAYPPAQAERECPGPFGRPRARSAAVGQPVTRPSPARTSRRWPIAAMAPLPDRELSAARIDRVFRPVMRAGGRE